MTNRSFVRRLVGTAVATLLLVASAVPTMGQENKYKQVWVKTPDGLTISAQDWGNPTGPEIVFIHGFSQSHLSWDQAGHQQRSRQGISHGDLRSARPRQFRQAA
jgi:hypothetical protein